MSILSIERRASWAKVLVGLFMSASLLAGAASTADAAPRAKCRTNPENFSFYRGKCMTDNRIEFLKERRDDRRDNNRGEDNHRPHGPNHQ